MKADIAKRWADALESGKYDQGKGRLERRRPLDSSDDGFCCLGVLCALAVEDGVIERRDEDGNIIFGSAEEFKDGGSSMSFPPESVIEWAGLSSENPAFEVVLPSGCGIEGCNLGHNNTNHQAAELNDDKGFTFEQIATLIREQHENL